MHVSPHPDLAPAPALDLKKGTGRKGSRAGARARSRFGLAACILLLATLPSFSAPTPRQTIAAAIVEPDDDKKAALIATLSGDASPDIAPLIAAWKEDAIYLYKTADDKLIPVQLGEDKDADGKQAATLVEDSSPLNDADGKPIRVLASDLEAAPHDSNLRSAMKGVLDLQALAHPDPAKRILAIGTLGMAQDDEKLPALLLRQTTETDSAAKRALREAIALIQLKDASPDTQLKALAELQSLASIASYDFVKATLAEASAPSEKPAIVAAAHDTLLSIDSHRATVNTLGTAFRGLSLGSILLLVALGLAITFGLMGVINMAHGEIMVVGAYATYIVQAIFGDGLDISPFGFHLPIPGMHLTGTRLDLYFIVALPAAFLSAALVGIALERTVIQFLYRRPLESLLATWGVSLVLQQLFRLVFGANNVQVYSPAWLSGNWTVNDIIFGWNRVFVIGFTIAVVALVWVILNRTPLGLLIRAVMQNRQMAACMGVPTERVNMLTFGLGSGLAGLAGAFLSQIGNVGPSLGQSYIVDCFMTVVVGGVGSIAGTVLSALAIGVTDQSLQQYLGNPVLGKILVLAAIIAFLQWRPAGLFVTKSRSLES